MKTKKILVTGVAGMIGSHLLDELLKKNYKEAEISLLKAYSISLQLQINRNQLKYLKELTEFYGRQNNYKAAFQYNTLFLKLSNQLDSSQNRPVGVCPALGDASNP